MSEIVFVLGAGASAHCGTPLMGNFLEVAEGLWRRGEVREAAGHFERVFDAIGYLQGIHSKAKLDTYNIETVYAAFEMGKLLGSLPGTEEMSEMEGEEGKPPSVIIDDLISSIKKVIAHTLEKTTRLLHGRNGDIMAPPYYFELTNIVLKLIEEKKSCSIVTFNYDLGLDYSLQKRGILPDYGLTPNKWEGKSIPYLKLHGSLNWGKCTKCREIEPYLRFDITESTIGLDYSVIPLVTKLEKLNCECGEKLGADPFIVPPTWNKTAYHEQIETVWKKAASELSDAEHIFVLGYSLPSTDLFFHYLFALGVDMRTILKGFYVYNIDESAEGRFKDLLGSGIQQRFHFYNLSFENAVGERPPLMQGAFGHIQTLPQILQIR